jgi:hypothetical protein
MWLRSYYGRKIGRILSCLARISYNLAAKVAKKIIKQVHLSWVLSWTNILTKSMSKPQLLVVEFQIPHHSRE